MLSKTQEAFLPETSGGQSREGTGLTGTLDRTSGSGHPTQHLWGIKSS